MLLSDIDSKWHDTVEAQKTYYAPDFKPDFWLVNGRAYPDTLKPHPLTITSLNANTNLTQLNYESYVHIKTNDKVLFRMINMGYAAVPWHIHGWHFQVIGQCPNLNTTNILEICNDKNNSYFFPQFYPMHNHDDYKVTNQGVYPGGQLTLIQTDAPTK